MPSFAGVPTLAASSGRPASAATFATTAASGAIQGAPAFLLNFPFDTDRVVDATIQSEAGDNLGVLIGRWHRAETVFG